MPLDNRVIDINANIHGRFIDSEQSDTIRYGCDLKVGALRFCFLRSAGGQLAGASPTSSGYRRATMEELVILWEMPQPQHSYIKHTAQRSP
jgi:hypothetical protein